MSNEIASSHTVIKSSGGNIKKDKHAIHIMFGCKRNSCTTCHYGQPFQTYMNMFRSKHV